MNMNVHTRGPLYRPDPEHQAGEWRWPAMPTRYQPRDIAREQTNLRPTPERIARAKATGSHSPDISYERRQRANRARAEGKIRTRPIDPSSKTQRVLAVIKTARAWVTAGQIAERLGDVRADEVCQVIAVQRRRGEVASRRAVDLPGTAREYCWHTLASDPNTPRRASTTVSNAVRSGSLTAAIAALLAAAAPAWLSTQEIAEQLAAQGVSVTPSEVSTRMGGLIRKGHITKRRRDGAKHGHGSTMEHRWTLDPTGAPA
jgi:hypothetical protein